MIDPVHELRQARRWMIVGELWAAGVEILVLLALVWAGWHAGPVFYALAVGFAACRGAWRVGCAGSYIWRVLRPTPPPHRERCLWPPRRHP